MVIDCYPLVGKNIIKHQVLRETIRKLADQITEHYKKLVSIKNPLLIIGILKGCHPFMSDLLKHINLPVIIEYVSADSYHGATTSCALEVVLSPSLLRDLKNQHVLVLDDVYDTGKSFHALTKELKPYDIMCIEFCVLFNKQSPKLFKTSVKWSGLVVPNQFLIGFGLDYRYMYRNLNDVYLLTDHEVELLNQQLSLINNSD